MYSFYQTARMGSIRLIAFLTVLLILPLAWVSDGRRRGVHLRLGRRRVAFRRG
ncbi:MAG: hypothetical protein ACLFM5_12390 [Spirochaetaceae bacterium]